MEQGTLGLWNGLGKEVALFTDIREMVFYAYGTDWKICTGVSLR